MATFALVHGAWHGPWCWEKLIPELERRGHRAIAVDVRFDDPEAGFADYAATFAAAVAGEERVIAVGHSLGGCLLPWIAELPGVAHLVYLCAVAAEPGRSFAESDREYRILNPDYRRGLAKGDDGTRWADADLARELFYPDCDDDIAAAAFERLRFQAIRPLRERNPFPGPASTPSTSIICSADRMVDPAWSRRVAGEWLGARPVELPGGHSPFYARPAELAGVLDTLA